eukprot:1184285-Prorocentrum_minimum.AAC.4
MESTAKRPSTSTQQSTVVDCRHWFTIHRTAFRIFDRIFDVYSLSTDCHMVGRQSTPCLAAHWMQPSHAEDDGLHTTATAR